MERLVAWRILQRPISNALPMCLTSSPFNLQNTSATSSSASFNILGLEVDSSTGQSTEITGLFTTPFDYQNYQELLSTVAGGATITTSFSAQFSTAPEPGTSIELILGLTLLQMGRVRFRSKAGKTPHSNEAAS